MLSKKQITRAVTFISMSVLTGLSSAVSVGLIEEEPLEVQAAVTDTETSTHPIADEKGIKMYKKKKVMYADSVDGYAYVYTDIEAKKENIVNTGGDIYLATRQKVTVLGQVGNWYYIKYRQYNFRDGSFSYSKAFIQKKQLKSKLSDYDKERIKMVKDAGYKYVEDRQYSGVSFMD